MKIENFVCDTVDLGTVQLHITLSPLQESLKLAETLNGLVGQEVDIRTGKHREKRSINANSYFYVLCGKLADITGKTKREQHDEEVCRYGQYLLDANDNITWCLLPADAKLDDMDAILKPTGKTELKKGMLYAWYAIMKPTHLYDSKEMAILIDGVVSDCKEQGIETLSDDEIKHMMASMEQENTA